MRHFKIGYFLAHIFVCQYTQATALSEKIDTIIQQQLPHATVAIVAQNARTEKIIYQKNADKLLSPASSIKLFTATAALYQLHPNYHFLTTLSRKKHNFYITFTGAPDLTREHFNELLRALKNTGITTITGNIIIDDSRFKEPFQSAGISYDDLGWYYAAPETAIILDENAVTYDVISAEKIGLPTQIKPQESNNRLTIINQVTTVSKNQEKEHCSLNLQTLPHNTVRLFGCRAKTKNPTTMHLAIPEPLLLAKQLIQASLKENHMTLKGQLLNGTTPTDAESIATIQSQELSKLISHMLKNSDNVYANSITRTLGYELTKEGNSKQGAFALKQIIAKNTQLDMSQVTLTDGMGTRYNQTTPRQMVRLLSEIYHDKSMYDIFIKALPQAGLSGTLQDRMKETPLNKIVFAKTGTMHDISSLSGYMLNTKKDPIIFSIIINGINTPSHKAKMLEEQILQILNDVSLSNI